MGITEFPLQRDRSSAPAKERGMHEKAENIRTTNGILQELKKIAPVTFNRQEDKVYVSL